MTQQSQNQMFKQYLVPVTYAENSHGGLHSVAHSGHLYLVRVVCDVIFMFPNQRFGEVC